MPRQNRHHIWHPRRDYKTPIERSFRALPCNVVWIDEKAHTLLHIYTKPPDKPSHEEMCACNLPKCVLELAAYKASNLCMRGAGEGQHRCHF